MAQLVAHRGFARTRPSRQTGHAREAGSSAAFPEQQQELQLRVRSGSQRALDRVKKACHCRLLTSRRPRQCSTSRSRTVARTCPEKVTRTWWQAGVVMLRLIALSEGLSRWKQQPLLACSSLILESFRRLHDALTSPGPVVPG
jgi:hypothetical protein